MSCSTVDSTKTKVKVKAKPAPVRNELKYISLMASIEFVNSGNVNEFNASINQNNDTLGLRLLGPFNMALAELFSNPEQFMLLDKWHAVLYKGKPTKENFNKALQFPISYQEIIGLIRCNPYGDISRFEKSIKQNDSSEASYYADALAKDSLWFLKKNNTISQYKHISQNVKESYSVNYSYGEFVEYPDKIVFLSGKNKLTLKIDKFSLEKFTVKSIKIPNNVQTVNLDETK